MRVVLQRVSKASVEVQSQMVGAIQDGYLLLVAVHKDDTSADVEKIVEKICALRLFSGGGTSFMEENIIEHGGSILVVSQFTLYGDVTKGTKPDFSQSAKSGPAERLYDEVVSGFLSRGIHTETGKFGAYMDVEIHNDGPVTLIIDSK